MKGRRELPWEDIKTEYVTTTASYSDLAKKYGTTESLVKKHGRLGGWVAERSRFASEKARKIEGEATERGMAALRRVGEIAEKALDRADELLGEPGALNGTQLEAAVSALQKAAAIVRDVYGIITVTEQARIDIDRDKLKLEREKMALAHPDPEDAGSIVIGSEVYGI